MEVIPLEVIVKCIEVIVKVIVILYYLTLTFEFAHIAREKTVFPLVEVRCSQKHVCGYACGSSLNTRLSSKTLFCSVKLVSGFELFLSVCIVGLLTKAGPGSQQKVLSNLGNWRSTVDWSCSGILNVWEISLNFLYVWHRVQYSREMYKVWINFYPDYISKVNISIIQVVFHFVFIFCC